MTKFEDELVKLLKKHKMSSLRPIGWNDPEAVEKYNKDYEAYAEKLKKFLTENPEPPKVKGTYDKYPDSSIKVRNGYYVRTAGDAVLAKIRDAWEDKKYKLGKPFACDYGLRSYSEYVDEVPSGFWYP